MKYTWLVIVLTALLSVYSYSEEPHNIEPSTVSNTDTSGSEKQSLEELLIEAQADNADAMYKLGDIYYFGKGVNKDPNEATEWYAKAFILYIKDAEAGDADAMYKVGKMYNYGEGIAKDIKIALEWYNKASEMGNTEAMYELGDIYYWGDNVEQNYMKAIEWFQKAAEGGNSEAIYSIGFMYETGKGVGKDYGQAKYWYKKAIELGYWKAKSRLLLIYLKLYHKSILGGFLTILIAGGFIFGYPKKPLAENVDIYEVLDKPNNWSLWMIIRRYIGAIVLYFIYWLTLCISISRVIGTLLSPDKAQELVNNGVISSIWEYGWGDHYIWFLIVFCFVTFCSATLTGATAKRKGAIVASIANLPILALMLLVCFFVYIPDIAITLKSPFAWKIIYPLSIVCSLVFVILGGHNGEDFQKSMFAENTILGIRPFHWLWLWLISPIYIQEITCAVIPLLSWSDQWASTANIPFLIIYGGSAALMYQILTGEILKDRNVFIRIVSFIGIYLGGLFVGALYRLLLIGISKLISWIF